MGLLERGRGEHRMPEPDAAGQEPAGDRRRHVRLSGLLQALDQLHPHTPRRAGVGHALDAPLGDLRLGRRGELTARVAQPCHDPVERGAIGGLETEIAAGIKLEVRFYRWQAEAYDEGWSGVDRSEDDWDEAGKRLATRLEAETGQPVEYVP